MRPKLVEDDDIEVIRYSEQYSGPVTHSRRSSSDRDKFRLVVILDILVTVLPSRRKIVSSPVIEDDGIREDK